MNLGILTSSQGSGHERREGPSGAPVQTDLVPDGLHRVYRLKPKIDHNWYYSDTLLAALEQASSESGPFRELNEMLIGENPTTPRVWVVLPSFSPTANPWERRLQLDIPKTSKDTNLEELRDFKQVELEFDEDYSRVLRASLNVVSRNQPRGSSRTGIEISHSRDTEIYSNPNFVAELWKELGDDLSAQRTSYRNEASELRRVCLEAEGLQPEHTQLISAFIAEMGKNFPGEFNVFGVEPFRKDRIGPYLMHLFIDRGFDLGVAQNMTIGLKSFALENPYFGSPAYIGRLTDGNYTFGYNGVIFSLQHADRTRLAGFLPALYIKLTTQAAEVDFNMKLEGSGKTGEAFGTFGGRRVVLLHQSDNHFGDGPLFNNPINRLP